MPTKSVTVQYRRAGVFGPGFDVDHLDRMIAAALDYEVSGVPLRARAKLREMAVGATVRRLLNKHDVGDAFVFGELVRYEPGALIPLIVQGDDAAELDLAQAEAEAGHDLVQGLIYFMVRGHHVGVIERGMRTGQLEEYLSWLLRQAGLIAPDARLNLESELVVEGGRGLENVHHAKLKLVSEASEIGRPAAEELVAGGRRHTEDLTAWDVLKTAGITDAALTEAATEPNTKLKVDLSFSLVRGRSRVELPERTLTDYLEDHPDDHFVLESKKGRQVGRALILRERADVEAVGVYIDPRSAAQALFAALGTFMERADQG